MSTQMKTSKYRHAKPTPCMKAKEILNLQPTMAIWDCGNFLAVNEKHIAVPWTTLGSVVILGHQDYGKVPMLPAMFMGHQGPVIDLSFHPYDPDVLFTASEDCTIRGWRIPEGGLKSTDAAPIVTLQGHGKKVGMLSWHPAAHNVLASSGPDAYVNIWDVQHEAPKLSLRSIKDQIMSLNWNLDGTLLNTTSKDKKVTVFDSRTGDIAIAADSHQGSKTQRSVWAKRRGLIVTVGFNQKQHRQAMVWDLRHMEKPVCTEEIDQQSTVLAPWMDEDTNMLYLAGRGDGSVKFYELWDDARPIVYLNTYSTTDPQRGVAFMPKKALHVKDCEVARFYKLTAKTLSHVSMQVPRKTGAMEFQEDLFPQTFADTPAIDADAFFAGKNAQPNLTDMRGKFTGESCATTAGAAVDDTAVTASPQKASLRRRLACGRDQARHHYHRRHRGAGRTEEGGVGR
jgi:coronin-1B/1C/6